MTDELRRKSDDLILEMAGDIKIAEGTPPLYRLKAPKVIYTQLNNKD